MALALPLPAWVGAEAVGALTAPHRRIREDSDVDVWRESAAHDAVVLFVMRLGEASVGHATQQVAWTDAAARCTSDDAVERVLGLLQTLDAWTDEIELHTTSQRFGNLAFRTWGARLEEKLDALHEALLPRALHPFIVELRAYLVEAFGSFVRIDYGTGHELNFLAWLGYLHRLRLFVRTDEAADVAAAERRLALEVFPAYLRVVWHLQDHYSLEPAGSHGVWGLDDYQFAPYIIGAAQLRHAETPTPQGVVSRSLYPYASWKEPRVGPKISVQETLYYVPPVAGAEPIPNLYISSLARIHSLKRGPFTEHSPLLTDVSSNVASWYKVYTGMLKMYDAECLLKRPVVQHFVFGGVGYPWPTQAPTPSPWVARAVSTAPVSRTSTPVGRAATAASAASSRTSTPTRIATPPVRAPWAKNP